MLRLQGYKFRLKGLNQAQLRQLSQMDGQARWLWNTFLAADLEILESGGLLPSYVERASWLPKLRKHKATQWLSQSSYAAQQTELRDLDMAWQRWRKGFADKPRFKKRGLNGGFRWSGRAHCKIDQTNSRVFLPRIGWLRYQNSRKVLGDVINAALSHKGGHWYISLGTEREIEEPKRRSTHKRIGIDLGVACHSATSYGHRIAGPNALKKVAKKLARAQREMARKKRGSKHRKKQVRKVARIHERVRNVRHDHLHKLTSMLAKSHGLVAIEDLKVSNMSRSAKGTRDKPGVNVAAKRGLNRSILDQGWGEMRRQLTYKLEWNGGTLAVVHPANTSRRCSKCNHVAEANRPSQAVFNCVACGHKTNADVNAAQNILAAGLAVAARGGLDVSQPAKREPTDWLKADARIASLSGARKSMRISTRMQGIHVLCE